MTEYQNRIRAYVPESLSYTGKDEFSCRNFFDDCAVVELSSWRVLACRGSFFSPGKACFSDIDLPSSLPLSPVASHPFAFSCKKGTALLFSRLFATSGLVLALYLPSSDGHVAEALRHLDRQVDWATPPCKKPALPFDALSALCDRLCEIFYYMDRMTDPSSMGLWTLAHTVANFVGCRTHTTGLPMQMPPLHASDCSRLTLFLLCAFLTLRERGGALEINGCLSHDRDFSLHFSAPGERNTEKNEDQTPLFLEAPCFASLLSQYNSGPLPTLHFPLALGQTLYANDPMLPALFFTLSFLEENNR